MDDLPKPPISPDVDLRNFSFMPLDVARLGDSDLALTAPDGAFRAAVLLWCKAWHQIPAGSLPNNERALARLAQCDEDAWHQIREESLRGFYLCDDGRLYHPVVVEKAMEAWVEKEKYRKAARKRWKGKRKLDNASHVKRIENASCDASKTHNASHMQETGTGTGTGIEIKENQNAAKAASPDLSDPKTQFYHRGRQVLGKSAGGQLTKLLTAMEDNVARSRAAIETASTKAEPRAYVARVIERRDEEISDAESEPLNPVLTL